MLLNQDTLSVEEVSRLTGWSPATIRRRLQDGTLTGRRSKPLTGWWRIDLASLERYAGKRFTATAPELA